MADTAQGLVKAPSSSCPDNDLPFSSERQGRLRAYHGLEEPRAQPAASRYEATFALTGVAFGCCNGLLHDVNPADHRADASLQEFNELGVHELVVIWNVQNVDRSVAEFSSE